MFLSLVDRSLVQRHLSDQVIDAAGVDRLLEYRAIPDGAPVFLDEAPMLPVEPSCSWFRHLAALRMAGQARVPLAPAGADDSQGA